MSQIVNVRDYNPSTDIYYAKPKISNVGGKSIAIMNSKTQKSTYLSTPLMLSWGLSEYTDKTGKVSHTLSLQFPSSEYPDEEAEMFLEKFKALEKKVKTDAQRYSKEWFGKFTDSMEIIEDRWNPMIHYPKIKGTEEFDYTRAPTLRLKIPFWEGEWKFELYDMEERQIWPSKNPNIQSPVELVPKLTRVACVIQCGGVYIINGKIGVTWKLFQAVVKPPQNLRGTCLIRLSANEKERMTQQNSNEEEEEDDLGDDNVGTLQVKDSDDEGSQPPPPAPVVSAEVEAEAEAEDTTVARKKVVRRKKNE